jgi:hypothetical protein
MAESTQHDVVEVVRARRIEIIDEHGNERIELGSDATGLASVLVRDSRNPNAIAALIAGLDDSSNGEHVGLWLDEGGRVAGHTGGFNVPLLRRIEELERTVGQLVEPRDNRG